MKVIIILALVIVVMLFVLLFLAKICRQLQADKSNLIVELQKQKNVARELGKYAEEISKIKGNKENVGQKIKEAQNEDEVINIINGLIAANNNKLCK